MSNWIVYHRGTGTFFSIDDDSFAVNVSELNDEVFDDFFDENDIENVLDTHGVRLSDGLFDQLIGEEDEDSHDSI